MIRRDALLRKLIDRRDNSSVKIITGIRRCGKSYLLFHLFRDYLLSTGVDEEHIISVDLELRESRELRNPDRLIKFIKDKMHSGKYYIFLDEIQLVPDFEETVSEINHFENTDVYITGSNSKFLSSDVITEFRGRGDEIRVRPLSFSEFYGFRGGDKQSAWNEFSTYGGMPALTERNTDEQKTEYLQRLIKEVYLRDVVEHNKLKNADLMDRIMCSLFSSVGSLTNPNRTCNYLIGNGYKDADNETVSKYMSMLEDAFIFEKCERFDIKGKEYLATPSKYYSADVGLRNARLNFRQLEFTHITENIIYNELRNRGFSVNVGIIRQRDKEGYRQLEVDFVANKGNRRYYIQSAYSCYDEEKRSQILFPLLKIRDSFRKIIITADSTPPWIDENGVLTINMIDFLLDEKSLDS